MMLKEVVKLRNRNVCIRANNMGGRYDWTPLRNEEFQEEDVWAVLKENTDLTSSKIGSSNSSTTSKQKLPNTTNIIIPGANNSSTPERKMYPQSAPVNIPDWSKIYGNNSKTASWLDIDDDRDDCDSDDHGKMVPKHEWIAKKQERSKTFSFCVCEGAGRTLKGRDLCRLRTTVLTKTGFLE